MIWFTSDPHFGHNNIIKYCNRPFKDTKEMDSVIQTNWNVLVKPKDIVYVLGDFSMSSDMDQLEDWFNSLRGRKILITGNHDSKACLKLPWEEVSDVKLIKHAGHKFWLSHYAHRTWPSAYHGALHLFGHSHGTLPNHRRSMDVGVDAQDFKPVSINQVIEMLVEEKEKCVTPPIKYELHGCICTWEGDAAACPPHEKLCDGCVSRECDDFRSQMESCEKLPTACDGCEYSERLKK